MAIFNGFLGYYIYLFTFCKKSSFQCGRDELDQMGNVDLVVEAV